jgi:hypothetical protein
MPDAQANLRAQRSTAALVATYIRELAGETR